jgi:Na+-transporting NADH:ubiquinone oxidoreductase subunit A
MGRKHIISKGITLPIKGHPKQKIIDAPAVQRVAVVADDFQFMKAKMLANVGDVVKRGQRLFEDRKNPGVFFTSPASGEVVAVNRGAKRKLLSVVIQLNENELSGKPTDEDFQTFESYSSKGTLTAESVRALLIESGMWTTLRARPFSQVPAVDSECGALFVTAIDTAPLAADVNVVLEGRRQDFQKGLEALALLCPENLFVCQGENTDLSAEVTSLKHKNASVETFIGQHPAGLVGTHIHTLYPVNRKRTAWHIGYQDVISVGRLFSQGKIDVERVISLAGPACLQPALLRTRAGAEIEPLVVGKIAKTETRLIDGSVFYGRNMSEDLSTQGFIGRYRQQVTAILEGRERVFLGWLQPGGEKYSTTRAFFSSLMSG